MIQTLKTSNLLIAAALLLCSAVFGYPRSIDNKLHGYWQGSIEKEGKTWRVNLNVQDKGGIYRAFVDFLDVDAHDLEFSIVQTRKNVRVERSQPNGNAIIFEGEIKNDIFKGNWSGTNTNAVFYLKRGKLPPKYFREEEVSFRNGDVTLSGTLILPLSKPSFPAVVFAHGSGAETRAPNRSQAIRFVKRGIAALVYDKRGTGRSTGEWRSASMEDLARDAIAGVEFLKTRKGINRLKVGVSGHSQGGWVAPFASTLSRDISFVIASAASGVSPDEQSIYHRANVMRNLGYPEEAVKIATDLRRRLYASGKLILENDPSANAVRKEVSIELAKYANEPWFESGAELPPNLDGEKPATGALELLFFKAVPMWEKVNVPVLLFWGEKDRIVPVIEGKAIIERALAKAGNKEVTARVFPNIDHGAVFVRDGKPWDFPRVDLEYYEEMVEWTLLKTKH